MAVYAIELENTAGLADMPRRMWISYLLSFTAGLNLALMVAAVAVLGLSRRR